ncbi:type II secretion system protein GspM, partial [Hansschlegelia zhihuaiae]|uniref:type II secretion system protein GspM n=1 Tax=Hansschlegelia zhihuaiae TaxID=405005 RepID=UPI001FE029DB
ENQKKLDARSIYLPGDGVELARAELQKLLVEAVSAADGKLIESQEPGTERASDAPDDGRVDLRVTFDATNDGLLDLIYGLETRLPLLTIERLETRRLDVTGEDDPEDPTLRVSLVVRGHRKVTS